MSKELESIKTKKAAMLLKLKELEAAERAAAAAEKQKQRKADDKAKLLLGVAVAAEAKRNPAAVSVLKAALENLTEKDRAAVAGSQLWAMVTGKAPQSTQEAAKPTQAPQGTTQPQRAAPAAQDAPSCPECGKPMQKKNGQRGEFWGCAGYPACRGTRSVEVAA